MEKVITYPVFAGEEMQGLPVVLWLEPDARSGEGFRAANI